MLQLPPNPPSMPPEVLQIVQSFFVTVAVIALGIPIIRAFTRRWERHPAPEIPMDVTNRLERIEQAVEAIAIEVERVAEGQRFSAKLLAEMQKERAALPRPDSAP